MSLGTEYGLKGYKRGLQEGIPSLSAPVLSELGCVLYLPLRTLPNGISPDLSGKGNHGTNHGAVLKNIGETYPLKWKNKIIDVGGRAMSFDGVDDYVSVPDSDSLDITEEITIEAWVYPTNVGSVDRNIVAKDCNSSYRFRIEGITRKLFLLINDGTLVAEIGENAVSENTWSHVVAKFVGSEQYVYLYINSVLDKRASNGKSSIQPSGGVLLIGAYNPGTEIFNGLLSSVRIYNRALSAAEIKKHYELERVLFI